MENKTAVVLVLAIAAALIVTASGAFAMGRQNAVQGNPYGGSFGSGVGPSMMGGYSHPGGMMGGYGMMGNWNNMYAMHEYMQQYMSRYWNSTATP